MIRLFSPIRFAIDNDSGDWTMAEGQVANLGHGSNATVVSVKNTGVAVAGAKRKAEEGGDAKEKDKKATRRGKKIKR